ncbi:hypothetical protein RHMOL_Rhmol05G0153000 [Rhododendron molle]|uniref:Uncharacterized protein n=1 Tax=Rhododendron molle TaxID=49168 RepID=A0ACC0NQT5_RHOML|nr:hypothetical protein RHMOL_Rhmol05G0153000 [Rhododendron molle]
MRVVPVERTCSAEIVETLGFREAVEIGSLRLDGNYILEGDAQSVIKILQGRTQVKANLEVIICDTLSIVSRFNSYSF